MRAAAFRHVAQNQKDCLEVRKTSHVTFCFQEDTDDAEPDCVKKQTDPIQELSLLQFLKSKSSFLLLLLPDEMEMRSSSQS